MNIYANKTSRLHGEVLNMPLICLGDMRITVDGEMYFLYDQLGIQGMIKMLTVTKSIANHKNQSSSCQY